MSTPRAIWQAVKFTFYLTVGIYFAYSVGVQVGTTF